MHVSQLDSRQLLRLSTWFGAKGENLVDELMKTAGTLTPEQEAVVNPYKPSRHPEMDFEFFARQRPWPMGDRLAIKRWPSAGGNPEFAMLYVFDGGLELLRPFADLAVRQAEVLTPDELLAECWEVD